MYPEICRIGPFTVYSYGLMLVVAFAVSSFLAGRQAKREGIDPEKIFNLSLVVFIFGVIGARIFYVAENIGYYAKNPLESIMLQHGGLSWFGGLLLGFILGVAYLKKNKLAVYKICDFVIPYVALGQAIGRIGCFLNGCCYGKVWAQMLIPTQLYSSLALLAIFVILRLLQERPHWTGQIFFTYLLLYSVKRFLIEFWRGDNPAVLFHLSLFQIISIAVFCLSLIKLLRCRNIR